MALESGHYALGLLAVSRGLVHAITIGAQLALQAPHRLAAFARLETGAFEIERRRSHPMADMRFAQELPRKFFAGILLAPRRDIGMRKHTIGRHFMSRQN